ncbi:MAG: agmatinase [Deltaproteobacteria bacterium CG11_big_fil_rev_8_21_14_0_20_45_16]|nr:MAG: agmatinase [Deltaproteobacteria bacterium CG11_big_fil_rev_8_21_14_0_20_45_16]
MSFKTEIPDARQFPRYSGVCSFFRFPLSPQPRKVDWVLYGVPFDFGTSYRPGARFGCRSIREQSAYIKPYHLFYKEDLRERFSIVDGGDAPVAPYDLEKNLSLHEEFSSAWRAQDAKTFAIGGDHSISVGNMRATSKALGKKLACIHFDAHTDTVDRLWDNAYTHASPIRRGVEEGWLDPKKSVSIGIRGPVNSATELDWGRDQGLEYICIEDFREKGLDLLRAFKKKIGNDPVYLTFDIDCMDPVFAPGTGTPAIGGFTTAEIISALRVFKGIQLVAADMVEVAPGLDPTQVTSLLAAHLVFEILCL